MAPLPARISAGSWRQALTTTVMTGPAIVLYTVLLVVPIGLSFYLSLTDWDGYSANPAFVGFANYARAAADPEVIAAAGVTLVLAGFGTVLLNVLGLGLALAVNDATRTSKLLRLVFFYPHVLSVLAIGFLWSAILGTNGAVNSYLAGHGWGPLPFLSDPDWALASLVGVLVWAGFGVNIILYLAGLQAVPAELLEAARIDGASRFGVFRHVTLPALRPTVTLNIVLSLVTLLKSYDIIVSLTGGGPAGRTQTSAYLILWDSFHHNQLGYGSAQSVLLMIVTALVALSVIRARRQAEMAVYG